MGLKATIRATAKKIIDSGSFDIRFAALAAVVLPGDVGARLDLLHLARGVRESPSKYHPIEELADKYRWLHRSYAGHRSTDQRLEAIAAEIGTTPCSIVDIGCNFGLLSIGLAEKGHLCTGIEYDPKITDVARRIVSYRQNVGAGFIRAEFAPAFCAVMPTYDYGLCLSLIHHIIMAHGVDYSRDLLSQLRLKLRHGLFLDMGVSSEKGFIEAGLPDMGEDHDAWISEFLLSAGFSSVEPLTSEGGEARDERTLFIARCSHSEQKS